MAIKHKIFCFSNGGSPGFLSAVALADDGNVLAGHCCSHEVYMKHDLGITSDWKHDQYDKHFGAGNWELEWVGDTAGHEGFRAALALNQAQGEQEAGEE